MARDPSNIQHVPSEAIEIKSEIRKYSEKAEP